jgi:hypothetical protein
MDNIIDTTSTALDKNESGKSKRKSANILLKELSRCSDSKTRIKEFCFYITLTKANIELIWCEEYEGQDAFTHPIYEHIKNRSSWMMRNRFIGIYPWRQNRDLNFKVLNVTQTKIGQPAYPRRYYLRIVDDDDESTPESRRKLLLECVNVSTYYS